MPQIKEKINGWSKVIMMSAFPNLKRTGGRWSGPTWRGDLILDNSDLMPLGLKESLGVDAE